MFYLLFSHLKAIQIFILIPFTVKKKKKRRKDTRTVQYLYANWYFNVEISICRELKLISIPQ